MSSPPTKSATLRFYAELKDFLPEGNVSGTVVREFDVGRPVAEVIGACGVPQAEVDLVIANGEPVDLSYRVEDGDRIAVYPVFEAFDIGSIQRLRRTPLRIPRFVADAHLGRLACYLRLLGLDTLHDARGTGDEVVQVSVRQRRILLTRESGLLEHRPLTHGYLVRHHEPRRQVLEVVRRFQLESLLAPSTRCVACNAELSPLLAGTMPGRPPPGLGPGDRTCASCGRATLPASYQPVLAEIMNGIRHLDQGGEP